MSLSHINLLNKKIGLLTIISSAGSNGQRRLWNVKCECGNTRIISANSLTKKNPTKSCGCLKKTHFIDLTGKTFNHITLLKFIGKNNYNCFIYEAICSCNKSMKVEGNDISSGKIKSCGHTRGENNRLPGNESLINNHFCQTRNKAEDRNHLFELTKDEFISLIFKNCSYCGTEPKNIIKNRSKLAFKHMLVNGIDRIDNNKGYIIDNVTTACYTCNQAKHRLTKEFFLKWIDKVYSFQHDHTKVIKK